MKNLLTAIILITGSMTATGEMWYYGDTYRAYPTVPGTTLRDLDAPGYVVQPDRWRPAPEYHPPRRSVWELDYQQRVLEQLERDERRRY